MQPAAPAALQLAQRLRQLRQQWSDARLTQEKLATAFSTEEKLAAATVSSWESLSVPSFLRAIGSSPTRGSLRRSVRSRRRPQAAGA